MSNYEIMRDRMSARFLEYDQQKMIRKFALEYDENYLYITFTGRNYRINRFNGKITWFEDTYNTEEKANYNEAMTIYDVLCYSKESCCLAQEWVHVGSLSKVHGGNLEKGSNFFENAGKKFDGKTEYLRMACENLGGKELDKGDVAYQLALFPFLPIILRFWESDEEFPASLQILVDRNILDYMHYETVMFAVSHVLERVEEEIMKIKKETSTLFQSNDLTQ